ncbi:DgyrCDS2860 [Dimorphilus gyrociliatus]|nr:DgyrCDS2860 [Dimorphilus gyrociliatus]
MAVRNETEMEPYKKNLCPIDKNYKANLNLIEFPEECPNSRVYQCANGKELKIQQSCMKKKSLQLYCLGWWKKPGSNKKIGVVRHGDTKPPNYKCFHASRSDNVETLVTFNQGIHMDLCEAEPRDYYSRDVYTFRKLDDSTWSKMICRFPSWFERRKWVDMLGRYRYETWNTDKELREKLIDGDGTRTFRCVGIRSDDDHFIIHSATSSSCDPIMHCIKGIRRGDKLVELLIGSHLREEDRWDCEKSLMKTEKKILLAEDTSLVECQIRGRHTDAEDERGGCKSNLNACLSPNVITIATLCKAKKLACYHTWHHGGHKYILVGDWEKKREARNCLQITEKGNTMTVKTAPECNMGAPHIFGQPINITLHLHRRKCHKRKSRQKEKKNLKKSGNEKRSELEVYMDTKTPENSAPSRTFHHLSIAICWLTYRLF